MKGMSGILGCGRPEVAVQHAERIARRADADDRPCAPAVFRSGRGERAEVGETGLFQLVGAPGTAGACGIGRAARQASSPAVRARPPPARGAYVEGVRWRKKKPARELAVKRPLVIWGNTFKTLRAGWCARVVSAY